MPPATRSWRELEATLAQAGVEVLVDDRDESAGAKFADHGPDRPALAGGGRAARRQAGPGRAEGARAPASAIELSPEALIGAARGLMFAPVERLIAGRYLRPRREEGFISVIAVFSLLGIALGVGDADRRARGDERLSRRAARPRARPQRPRHAPAPARGPDRLRRARRPPARAPTACSRSRRWSTGQVMATANGVASGALVRGIRPEDLAARATIADHLRRAARSPSSSDDQIAIGSRMAYRMGARRSATA